MAAMKENTKRIIEFLRTANGPVTSADVAAALELDKKSVDGSFTAIQKKGYGKRILVLTDSGMTVDLDAEDDAE